MKTRLFSAIVVAIALTAAAGAQDAGTPRPAGQSSGQNAGSGQGGGYGQRGGRGRFGGMMGRGLMGTVTEATADHYTLKTDAGDVYTVHFTSNTRIVKMGAGRGPGGGGGGQGAGGGQDRGQGGGGGMGRGGYGGNPPQQLKPSDIKIGDVINVMGDTDASSKSVNATAIAQVDPERVKQMREMEANFGKTWLQGKVTAINEATITLTGTLDNAPHTVVADENTTFRRRRDPITLADIQVGDMIRADGAVKNGVFAATAVMDNGTMGGEPPSMPRTPPPQ